MIKFDDAKKILTTLPISYYLNRRVEVELKTVETSYCDIFNDKIVVSYNQFKDANISEENSESDIRCILYHEVSHALLTPLNIFEVYKTYYITEKYKRIMNVFEDERIETICRDYYYDVDFKNFIKRLNHFNNSDPKDAFEYFYQIVRFDTGDKDLLDKKFDLIVKMSKLNRDAAFSQCKEYYNAVLVFYREVEARFNSKFTNTQSVSQNDESNSNESNSNESNSNESNSNENNSNESNSNETTSFDADDDSDIDDDSSDTTNNNEEFTINKDNSYDFNSVIKDAIKSFNKDMNSLINKDMEKNLEEIILRKKNFEKHNGSAINSYSGVFDTKSVARNDYKYFVKQNRLGNVKNFSKIKLNLFIDCSSSFQESENIVNQMLYCLRLLEKKDNTFSFDLITMTVFDKLVDKEKRQISCQGCNDIKNSIFKTYNTVNNNDAKNINIVLFDGYAFSGCNIDTAKFHLKNFGAFNHSNCIIITDSSNEPFAKEYAKNAKLNTISSNYATSLIKTVFKMLRQSF